MAEVSWAPQALDDLESIADFISRDSRHFASLFTANVFQAVERLQEFPDSGRMVPETHDESLREILFGNYRIIYRVQNMLVEILTVHHSARLLDIRRIQDS